MHNYFAISKILILWILNFVSPAKICILKITCYTFRYSVKILQFLGIKVDKVYKQVRDQKYGSKSNFEFEGY